MLTRADFVLDRSHVLRENPNMARAAAVGVALLVTMLGPGAARGANKLYAPYPITETNDLDAVLDDDVDVTASGDWLAGGTGDAIYWIHWYTEGPAYDVISSEDADIERLQLDGIGIEGATVDVMLRFFDCAGAPIGSSYDFTGLSWGSSNLVVSTSDDVLGDLSGIGVICGFILKTTVTSGGVDFEGAQFLWEAADIEGATKPLYANVIIPVYGAEITERNLIDAAIAWWTAALPHPGLKANPVIVTFVKRPLGGGLAASVPTVSTDSDNNVAGGGVGGGTLFAGRPQSGYVKIATGETFFVDDTPRSEEEFTAVPTADDNPFDDTDTFFFRNFTGNGGQAQNQYDLLTVILHELGHILGWDGDFIAFQNRMDNLQGGDDDLNDFDDTTHGWLRLEGDGEENSSNESECDNINEVSHLHHDIDPYNAYFDNDLMNPYASIGRRRLLSPLDISALGTAYGYTVHLNPEVPKIPMLGGWARALLVALILGEQFWAHRRLRGREKTMGGE